jgi:hypothetical protein
VHRGKKKSILAQRSHKDLKTKKKVIQRIKMMMKVFLCEFFSFVSKRNQTPKKKEENREGDT